MNARFEELRNHMHARGHRGKCVVIAIALLTGRDYDVVLTALNEHVERKVSKRGGYYPYEYMPVLKRMLSEQGKQLEQVALLDVRKHAKTTRTLDGKGAARLGIEYGLCHSRGHVCAVVNYRVADWAQDRVKRISRMFVVRSVGLVTTGDES